MNKINLSTLYDTIYREGELLRTKSIFIDFFTPIIPGMVPSELMQRLETEYSSNFEFYEFDFDSLQKELSIFRTLISPVFLVINKSTGKSSTLGGEVFEASLRFFLDKNI